MARYLLKRFVTGAVTVFVILTLVFFMARLTGSPLELLMPENATAEDIANITEELGLNEPLLTQYGIFVTKAIQGDFGQSIRQGGQPALSLILERLPATFELAGTAFLLGTALAFVLGVATQPRSMRKIRRFLLWVALLRNSVPIFLFGLMLIMVFSVRLGWFPTLGRGSWQHVVLPAVTLATLQTGLFLRLFNSSFAEERSNDYVRTAFAKGMSERAVIVREMLPNALIPVITILGLNFAALVSGTVVTETVFSWPGVGRLIVQAVQQRDYPVVQAGILVVSVIFVGVNIVVDVIYALVDPRVRLE